MKKMRILITLCIAFILMFAWNTELQAQNSKTAKEEMTKESSAKKDSTKKKITIADKTKKSKKVDGLFTLYQDTTSGKLQMLVTNDQLDKEFIYQSFSMGGPPALFLNQNMLRETWVFSIHKVYDKIQFKKVNTRFYFDPEKAISKAANADVSNSNFYTTKIIASDSVSMLIEVDKLFLSNVLDQIKPNTPRGAKPGSFFNVGKINSEKSFYKELRSFPQNTDVVVSLSFDNPSPANQGGKDISDARFVEVKMQHSFIAMPDDNFKPRFDDPRVGYFMEEVSDMSSTDVINYRDMIHRWRLEKKDPDAALSEPVKPIVWWVENTTPRKYVNLIVDAGHKWNEAFEKAGFKNAVQMKVMSDTASWDPADIRYNVIRWVSSDLGFAIGPSFVNPRTGEILGADITIDLGMLSHTLDEEILADIAFGAHDYEAKSMQIASGQHQLCNIGHGKKMQYGAAHAMLSHLPDAGAELEKLSEQFITELVLHEMGHTMGLGHNMKASQMLSPEELHDVQLTRELGLTASIMDYTIVNVHSDHSKQGDYYSVKTGPYDWWAIEYGYSQFPEGKEAEGLKEILAKSKDPKLDYGNDSDICGPGRGIDPRVMVWDQSNDIVTYAVDRFKLVDNSLGKLKEHFISGDKTYHELVTRYYYLQRHRYSISNAVSRYIGGIYVDRRLPDHSEGNKPYTPVPESYQRKAMQLLADELFASNAHQADQALYPYLQRQRRGWNFGGSTEDPKIQNLVLGQQMGPVNFILHPVTLSRLNSSSLYGNSYSVDEVMNDLIAACFEEDMKSSVNLFRQNLQREVLKSIIKISDEKSKSYDHSSQAAALSMLKKINKDLKKNRKKGNSATIAHRESMMASIAKALKV